MISTNSKTHNRASVLFGVLPDSWYFGDLPPLKTTASDSKLMRGPMPRSRNHTYTEYCVENRKGSSMHNGPASARSDGFLAPRINPPENYDPLPTTHTTPVAVIYSSHPNMASPQH